VSVAGPGPAPYRWVILGVAVFAFLQTHVHRLGFAPLIPTFVADLGLSYAAAGTLQTAYFWTYTIAQVPIGIVADRWGSRRVMLVCMALLAVGAVAFATSGSFAGGIAARMLVGLGAAAVWVPAMRLVSEWFPVQERARATGLISSGGGVGGTVGLVLIPWLASLWGWRLAYGVTAVPAVVTFVLITVWLRPVPGGPSGVGTTGSLRRVVTMRALWRFNAAVFFTYGSYFSFLTFLPAFLVAAFGVTRPQAGIVTGLITATTIVSWPLAGWLSDRLGRRKPLFLASQAAAAVAFVFFALAPPGLGLGGAMVAAVVTGIVVGGVILPFVMVGELVPRDLVATAAGVTNTMCFAGMMILPTILGALIDATGRFTEAFLLAAALQGFAFAAGIMLPETGSGRRGRGGGGGVESPGRRPA
jgi:MFS family permease